ncbi:MAG: hypothetical protein ACRDZM_10525, partial [Acidimicrobiia bacterium]
MAEPDWLGHHRPRAGEGAAEAPPRLIADWTGELTDPAALAATLSAEPGVIEHGLFPGSMVSD